MKSIALYISAAIIALPSQIFATESADTVITFNSPEEVIITQSSKGIDIKVNNSDDTDDYNLNIVNPENASVKSGWKTERFLLKSNLKKHGKTFWDVTSGGFSLGFNTITGAAPAQVEMAKSLEIAWTNIFAVTMTRRHSIYNQTGLSLGVGIDWRNYRTTLDSRFVVDRGVVGLASYPDGVTPRFSRIKVFSVQFPLLFQQTFKTALFDEPLTLRFGPIFNINTHGSVLSRWIEDGVKYKESFDCINLRRFTIDLYALIPLCDIGGIYVKYSPYHMLTGHQGLNFRTFSTGISFWF